MSGASAWLLVLAGLVGLGAGGAAVGFRFLILGFTYVFTGHLDTISEEFKGSIGQGKSPQWPRSSKFVKAPKNDGITATGKNLNHIRRKGRRSDADLVAQLLVWEADGAVAGFVVNSAIVRGAGNEILILSVVPAFRGRGEGRKLQSELLTQLHPRVDLFARCPPGAKLYMEMLLRRGFLPLDKTDKGVRILKLPKLGSTLVEQKDPYQQLEPFVQIAVK